MQIRIVVQTDGAARTLEAIRQRLDNLAPALTAMKEVGLDSIRQTFQAGGRPTPWAPLRSPRRRGSASAAIPLNDTGHLRASITAIIGRNSITFGTNVPYAAMHHFGGTISLPVIVPRQARALRFVAADGTVVFARRVRAHTVSIPARPFMVLQPQDVRTMGEILAEYLARGR
jgi:phage gpG-like protein